MDNQNSQDQFGQNSANLSAKLTSKINYLDELKTSLKNKDDLKIYQLINPSKFSEAFNEEENQYDDNLFKLANDLTPELSHYLSDKLIDYLGEKYPFFYYHEYELGKFSIYFGNWWNHYLFGSLDAVNVKFDFDEQEYEKLSKSFKYEKEGQRINDPLIKQIANENEKLEELMDGQKERDEQKRKLQAALKENAEKNPMPWDAGKVKEEKKQLDDQLVEIERIDEKASQAPSLIKENESKILKLSKDETILGFERQSIKVTFGTFEDFVDQNNKLYESYLFSLKNGSKVNKGE
ncbi:hypothetical protein [Lentilactobacillus laojiaonis]|uniref:hypothetical protein n=1 Tax=Lentilactobacillus laojiaonis TaxID=2883998 RepID=UPI001D0B7809|nr:hypothetical protein [Lentilactobacillus laojiaonis]UDM32626.1 hypothetical protein LHL71_02670 [Lentilactobacillus laojiaonis]